MKISDFKIAEFLLRAYCKLEKTTFIDLPIQFADSPVSIYTKDGLTIGLSDKLNKTCFSIVGAYVSADASHSTPNTPNESKVEFLSFAAAVLRDLSYSKHSTTSDVKDQVLSKINRNPFIWGIRS